MGSTGTTGTVTTSTTLPPRGGGGRVSFLFRRSEAAGHCAGVNALALSRDERHLWTGSRDSIVACWDTSAGPQPALMHEHVGHVDWVNDLALVGDVLVSCSSDKTLRVWQPGSPEPALGCLTGHSDFVTSLAASASGGMLASAGLRGEVLLWDLAALRQVMAGSASDQGFGASAAEVPRDSVYGIAMNEAGTLLAAGSTQAVANLVDVRSGQGVMQLKGHTDNIRALQLDATGRLLLTGSADHTMKLWDLGQQRCVQTLAVHTDSVWALAASSSFATVYSGGRDGCIYRTRLATRVSELVACEQHPVLGLAVSSTERYLWAATTSPSVHKWEVESSESVLALALPVSPRSPLGAAAQGAAGLLGPCCFVASPSAAARARLTFEPHGSRPTPQQLQPVAATPGLPPIQHATPLTDRRHVLTQDAEGMVSMWDITAGAVVRDFGRCELKEVEQRLFEPFHSVSAWCAPEWKLGSLAGTMEAPQCFGAEIYAQDLGDEQAPIDLKVNFGEQMLTALFAGWTNRHQQLQQERYGHPYPSRPLQPLHRGSRRHQQRHSGSGGAAGRAAGSTGGSEHWAGDAAGGSEEEPQPAAAAAALTAAGEDSAMADANSMDGPGPSAGPAAPAALSNAAPSTTGSDPSSIPTTTTIGANDVAGGSRFRFQGPLPPVVMVCGSGASVPWRCATNAFTGEEEVPQWVAECVLKGHFPVSRELKMAFQLLPLPGSALPSLLQSKLNAPRVLRLNKVADYLVRKMEESGIFLREEPLYWDPAKAERWAAEQAGAAGAVAAADGGVAPNGRGSGAGGPVDAYGHASHNQSGLGSLGGADSGSANASVHQLHQHPRQQGAHHQPGGAVAAAGARPGLPPILITCAGHTVPWDFSLAAVRQWIWRRSDDLVLHYSVREPGTPLRLPAIRPPS